MSWTSFLCIESALAAVCVASFSDHYDKLGAFIIGSMMAGGVFLMFF